jgi:hypothetical protein
MTCNEANALSFELVYPRLTGQLTPRLGQKVLRPYGPDAKAGCWIHKHNGIEFWNDCSLQKRSNTIIDFVCLCLGLDPQTQAKEALDWINQEFDPFASNDYKPKSRSFRKPNVRLPEPKQQKQWKEKLQSLSKDDLKNIRDNKGSGQYKGGEVSIDGLEYAASLGRVGKLTHWGQQCYAVTDSLRLSVDIRRIDGEKFRNGAKAVAPTGFNKNYPLGIREIIENDYPYIMISEGSGDFLTSHSYVKAEGREDDVGILSILGSGNDIPPEVRQALTNRIIWIYADQDKAGLKAANKWKAQLRTYAKYVEIFDYNKLFYHVDSEVSDLGEFHAVPIEQKKRGSLICPTDEPLSQYNFITDDERII